MESRNAKQVPKNRAGSAFSYTMPTAVRGLSKPKSTSVKTKSPGPRFVNRGSRYQCYLSQYPTTSPTMPNAHFRKSSGYVPKMITSDAISRMRLTPICTSNFARSDQRSSGKHLPSRLY